MQHANRQILCTNCSLYGHSSKQCQLPITSYGVIVFRFNTPDGIQSQPSTLLSDPTSKTGLEPLKDGLEVLLIQRRDSIGFVEMIRGKYRLTDSTYIKQQLAGMTPSERTRLLNEPFDTLWDTMWGPTPTASTNAYKMEKDLAKNKLETLVADGTLKMLIEESGPGWDTPEWGFPKGRRDPHESEYACAMRELWEETNIAESDIYPIRNLDPISETFFGTNHVHYCHKYFLAYLPGGTETKSIGMTETCMNDHMRREVGAIQWFSVEDALAKIRPESVEKREVLLRASSILRNFCPLLTKREIAKS